jgi:hypothetical protein
LFNFGLFDSGSVRKQFVAAAVLFLVEDKRLSLSEDICKYIPELPDYGHKIPVDHLLTHTSGIRDWQPLLNLAGGDPDAMTMILRQRGLNFTPGEEWSYSNSGYVQFRCDARYGTSEPYHRPVCVPFNHQKGSFSSLGRVCGIYVAGQV